MTRVGYARVSKGDQDVAAQRDALVAGGAEQIFEEHASGGTMERPQLRRAIASLGNGDVLVVWKLDRLARSLSDLLTIIGTLKARSADLCSLTETIDTTSAAGVMLVHLLGAFAQFERAMTSERTHLGLATAKRNGIRLGPRPIWRPDQARVWVTLVETGDLTIREAAHGLNVSRSTMKRILRFYRKGVGHDDKKSPSREHSAQVAAKSAARRGRQRNE